MDKIRYTNGEGGKCIKYFNPRKITEEIGPFRETKWRLEDDIKVKLNFTGIWN